MNNGWVQDLFPKEDVDGMISGLRNEAKGAGVPDTADAMSAYFLETVKSKFKMILCFSPVGDNFRVKYYTLNFCDEIGCSSRCWMKNFNLT